MDATSQFRSQKGIAWVCHPHSWPDSVAAGLSTRRGGVSQGARESLNLGSRTGDDPRRIAENLRRLSLAVAAHLESAARIELQHGAEVRRATGPGSAGPGDVLVTRQSGLALALTVADCFPLFLVSENRGVALAHCGWRGILAGVVTAAVKDLVTLAGTEPRKLIAWIGPGIRSCCFTLPATLAARFPASSAEAPRDADTAARGAGIHVDLAGTIAAQLSAAGLPSAGINTSDLCTSCRANLFYSHRRDDGRTGRMLAWIVAGIA